MTTMTKLPVCGYFRSHRWAGQPACQRCGAAKPTSTIVAWCPECETYCPAIEIGLLCPGDHETWTGERKLIKRRGYICRMGCEEQFIFWSAHALQEHQEGEHGWGKHVPAKSREEIQSEADRIMIESIIVQRPR